MNGNNFNHQMAPATVLVTNNANDVHGFNTNVNPGYVAPKNNVSGILSKIKPIQFIKQNSILGIILVLLTIAILILIGYLIFLISNPTVDFGEHLKIKNGNYDITVKVDHIKEDVFVESFAIGNNMYNQVNVSITNNSLENADISNLQFALFNKKNEIIDTDSGVLMQTERIDEFPRITFFSGVTLSGYLFFDKPIEEGTKLGIGVPKENKKDLNSELDYYYIKLN
ncbi:MAG: DUF4352 domain-containing protein [Bacilli bacterium]|nr:DUF4352 domain-containing protein [Bacilli bacterium]